MSHNTEPMISVIIALYNPGKYLRDCLDSIVNQTYKNLEIILVDDGSTDQSLAVCKEYAAKDNRIIVHHKENSGVSATRNVGIRLAHGDYFSFIDSDDTLEVDAYEYMINLINEHKVDAVNYEYFITYEDRESEHKLKKENYGLFDRKGSISQLINNVLFAWNKLFSKKIIDDVWFCEDVCRGEDSLFAIQAFDKADKVWFDARPLYHYKQSDNSAVRGKFRTSQLTAVNLIDIYYSFLGDKHPEFLDKQMGTLMNLMTTLYFDMRYDKGEFKEEKKLVIKKFREMYSKTDIKVLPKKKRTALKMFRFSPNTAYMLRRINILMRRFKNGK